MLKHISRCISMFLIVAFLLSSISPVSAQVQQAKPMVSSSVSAATPAQSSPPLPVPQQLIATPVVSQHLPSLAIQVDSSLIPANVGDTVPFTITVTNQAPDPAKNMVVALPIPAEAIAQPSDAPVLRWDMAELMGKSSASFTVQLRIVAVPAGGALLLDPQVTAQGLPMPATRHAGLLINSTTSPTTAQYSPNQDTILKSTDGSVDLNIPAGAYNGKLTLGYSLQTTPGQFIPSALAGWHRGFGTFFLTATDPQGQLVTKFAKPLNLTIHYTPEQLQAVGIVDGDLAIFRFDESSKRWVPLEGSADAKSKTITARIDSGIPGDYQLSDGSSPSNLYLPSLQGWQVNLFTGAASYSMPIDVPAGPNGIKPNIALSYDSSATDSTAGVRGDPAPWVGRDWNLASDSVSLNKTFPYDQAIRNYYTLVINGKSYDLVREACLPTLTCDGSHATPISNWVWNTSNEAFLRVRAVYVGTSSGTHGGYSNGVADPIYKWQVWTKDGTMYEYAVDAFWGFYDCVLNPPQAAYMEEYKWNISKVVDVFGNAIKYNYTYQTQNVNPPQCDSTTVSGYVDWNVALTSITWGGNINTGSIDRYRVDFLSAPRQYDISIANDTPANQLGSPPYEYLQLNAVKVESDDPTYGWQQVRQYNFAYDYSLYSDSTDSNHNPNGGVKLTLLSVQRQGSDNHLLPATTFSYTPGSARGNGQYPVASWNRLIGVNNNQGGKVTFNYENIDQVMVSSVFFNRRRVISRTLFPRVWDNTYPSYTWTYAYTHPAMNWDGTEGFDSYPNSAQVWYARYINPSHGLTYLVHPRQAEFRGHGDVIETDPNGNQIEHKFMQGGEANCTPNNPTDSCFVALSQNGFLVGQEYDTIHRAGAGSHTLSEVNHYFTAYLYDKGDSYFPYADGLSGIWHGFEFENKTVETSWGLNTDSGGSWLSQAKTTNYLYETGANQYGRLLSQAEYDATSTRVRKTNYLYDTNVVEGGAYILDRQSEQDILVR